jgi:hypothetical protein
MANLAESVMLLVSQGDDSNSSYAKAVCLAEVTGDNTALAVFGFVNDGVFEDTVT